MSDKKIHLAFITLIALLSILVTLTNLGLRKDFIGDDVGVSLVYPDSLNKSVWNMWDEITFPGKSNTLSTVAFIFAQLLVFAYKVGFSSILIQRTMYFLFFFGSGSGFYFLFNRLIKKGEIHPRLLYFASFTSSLLYSFNYLTTIMASFPLTNYHISYLLLPWLLLCVIKTFDDRMNFKSIFVLALAVLFIANGNPSNTLSILGFVLIFTIFFKHDYKIKIKHFIILISLLLLFSSYIYFPIIMTGSNPYTNVSANANTDSLNFNSTNTSFLNLFRFYGFHSSETFPFYRLQAYNLVFIYLSFLVPILIIFALMLDKSSRMTKLLLFFSLVFLFLAKGNHAPFSSWFLTLFDKIFIFQIYRATYYKFVPFITFSFSILLGFTIIKIKNKSFAKALMFFVYLLPILIVVNAWPLLTGQSARKIHLAEIPFEYRQTGEFMRGELSDFKVLSVPQISGALLKWGEGNYYAASYYPEGVIFGRPVWVSSWFDGKLEKYLSDKKNFGKDLSLTKFFNIKYILVHHDIVENSRVGTLSPDGISLLLDNTSGVKQISKNKYYSIYEIDDDHYLPHLYLPDSVYTADNSGLDILETGIPISTGRREVIYFTKQNETKLKELKSLVSAFKVNREAFIEYKKIDPTKYILNVRNATGIFPLVFSESFHPGWKIYAKNNNLELNNDSFYETWFSSQIDDDSHLVANGYANSWILNTEDLCRRLGPCTLNNDGTYNIFLIIEFKPQQYFYLGLLISGCSIIIASLVCLVKGRGRS